VFARLAAWANRVNGGLRQRTQGFSVKD